MTFNIKIEIKLIKTKKKSCLYANVILENGKNKIPNDCACKEYDFQSFLNRKIIYFFFLFFSLFFSSRTNKL